MSLSKFKFRQNSSGYKIICLIIFLFISIHSNAQNEKFTISGRGITIKQVFEQIEAQSKYTVAYSKAQIDVGRKITINVKKAELKEVLEKALKDTGFTYKINGLHIIIIPVPSNSTRYSPTNHKGNCQRCCIRFFHSIRQCGSFKYSSANRNDKRQLGVFQVY